MLLLAVVAVEAPAVESLLPERLDSWSMEGAVATYEPDTLFEYINGEAELYLPYGFGALASARYGKGDLAVMADVYRMGSALDAFGVYSNFRRATSERVELGAEGIVSAAQVMFHKGPYFVRLARSGRADVPRDELMALARLVADRLPGDAAPPEILAALRLEGVVPGTQKYLAESLLGYAFFPRGLVAEVELEDRDGRVFVVLYESPEQAREALAKYADYLREEGMEHRKTEDTLEGVDPLYKGVAVRVKGDRILGAIGLGDGTTRARTLDRLEEAVRQP